jgi:hypothetical protein
MLKMSHSYRSCQDEDVTIVSHRVSFSQAKFGGAAHGVRDEDHLADVRIRSAFIPLAQGRTNDRSNVVGDWYMEQAGHSSDQLGCVCCFEMNCALALNMSSSSRLAPA